MIKIFMLMVALLADSCKTPGALTIFMENPVTSGRIQMERFIPVEIFRKIVIPFEVLPFCLFYQNDRNSLYHLSGLPVPGLLVRRKVVCFNPGHLLSGVLQKVQL